MLSLLLTALLSSLVLADIDVNVWVEEGYFYGYNCELTFQVIADNFSSGENIHISTDYSIGFENRSNNYMLVQAQDLKEYRFVSGECPVANPNQTNTCMQIFGQNDNVIPLWAQLLRPYNSTHKYFLARIKRSYCPVNHTILPKINVVVPLSYSGYVFGAAEVGVKYNKTLSVSVGNLTYRDMGDVTPQTNIYQLGCSEISIYSLSWTFKTLSETTSWYSATLTFPSPSSLSIDTSTCAPSCILTSNSLTFLNPNFTLAPKNMSAWNNQQFNQHLLSPSFSSPQTIIFNFAFSSAADINYTF